jgi:hypothetical protein
MFVILFELSVASHQRGNLCRSIVAHPFKSGILANGVLYFYGGLVNLDFQAIDIGAHVHNGLFVDIHLDSK